MPILMPPIGPEMETKKGGGSNIYISWLLICVAYFYLHSYFVDQMINWCPFRSKFRWKKRAEKSTSLSPFQLLKKSAELFLRLFSFGGLTKRRLLTSRSETHVLLAIKNKASHWLVIWTISSTLTYCKRTGERRKVINLIFNNDCVPSPDMLQTKTTPQCACSVCNLFSVSLVTSSSDSLHNFSLSYVLHSVAPTKYLHFEALDKIILKSYSIVLQFYLLYLTDQS